MRKLFIFDVDGVLLDLWGPMKSVYEEYVGKLLTQEEWDKSIIDFLHSPKTYSGFGQYFEEKEIVRDLPPINGMILLALELKLAGFDLAIISSASNKALDKRIENITKYFGNNFNEIICVGMEVTKEDALRNISQGYDVTYFCDDHPHNVILSHKLGITSLWMKNYHQDFLWNNNQPKEIISVSSANDIYNLLLNN